MVHADGILSRAQGPHGGNKTLETCTCLCSFSNCGREELEAPCSPRLWPAPSRGSRAPGLCALPPAGREHLPIPATQAPGSPNPSPGPATTAHTSWLNGAPQNFLTTGSWGCGGPAGSRAQVPLAVGPPSHEVLAREGWFQKSTCCPSALLLSWKERCEGRRSLLTAHVLPKAPEPSSPTFPSSLQPPWCPVLGSRGCEARPLASG